MFRTDVPHGARLARSSARCLAVACERVEDGLWLQCRRLAQIINGKVELSQRFINRGAAPSLQPYQFAP
jgi:hypothetical protein